MTSGSSIRGRLSRAVATTALGWAVAAFGLVWGVVHWQIDAALDDALQESAEIVYGVLQAQGPALVSGQGGSLPAPPHDERLVWQLVDADGRVAWRSHRAPAQPLAPAGSGHWTTPGLPDWHVYRLSAAGGATLMVAQPHAARRRTELQAGLAAAACALLAGLASAFWLRRRTARELQPLEQLSRDVAAYQPLAPGAVLPPAARDELVPLRDAVTGLGERLARLLASERAFSAHAAHALRTPLAGMDAQLALAQRQAAPEVAERIGRARGAAARLGRVVTALLALFRSGDEPPLQPVDLAGLARALPSDGITVAVHGQAVALADPDLLAAALANLLDNAARHGAARVEVQAIVEGGEAVLHLRDDGPGADDTLLVELRAALEDGVPSQRLGLGLLLAHRIAAAQGGRLVLERGRAGGFGVALRLPAAPV